MKLYMELNMDNAAFQDDGLCGSTEASRIMIAAAKAIERDGLPLTHIIPLRDANGNKVGRILVDFR